MASVDEEVAWDGVEREVPSWNRDHSLRSGIEVSAVWMYQLVAAEVGARRMAEFVAGTGYGNAETGPNVTEFWLRGDLRISPLEQLDFLERLVTDDLPFAPEHQAAVRDIIVRERGDDWTWSHKTGTALAATPTLGWLVGTTSFDDRDWVFALNLDLGSVDDVGAQIDPADPDHDRPRRARTPRRTPSRLTARRTVTAVSRRRPATRTRRRADCSGGA